MNDITQIRNVLFGSGAINEVGRILSSLNVKKPFVLTYSEEQTIIKGMVGALRQKGFEVYVSNRVQTEPDLLTIDGAVSQLLANNCDSVIAIGGGSVIDTGKAVAMIAANGGKAEEYQMHGRTAGKATLPLVAIPTTAGTGSEATKVSVIYNNNNHLKKSIYSPYMVASAVLLDPDTTLSLPPHVTASTGIDALSHAIESYVSLDACTYTEMYSLKAVELIGKYLITAVSDGGNIEARANMLSASYFAGCALHAGIGLAHIIAQPIGGLYKIPHGDACSIFLPHSMKYNLSHSMEKYCDIARALGLKSFENNMENARFAVSKVKEIIAAINAPSSLTGYVNSDFNLDEAVGAIFGATGHIKCNPRPVDAAAIKEVLGKVLIN